MHEEVLLASPFVKEARASKLMAWEPITLALLLCLRGYVATF